MHGQIHRQPTAAIVTALLEAAGLPAGDLHAAMLAHFFAVGDPAAPAGVIGVELYGSDALLRSLVVRESERRRGTGRALVAAVENYACTAGVRSVYLLTETATAFFSSLGYAVLAREHAPPAIRATTQFSTLCPESADLMHKALATPPDRLLDQR